MDFILRYFDFSTITAPAYIAVAVAVVCGVILLIMLRGRLVKVAAKVKHDDEEPIPVDGYPSVSVIVYTQRDGLNLRMLLEDILQQDYPAPFEVIVVNDEKIDLAEDIVSALQTRYSNLYMTFAPERSRNLSRKKLAVTLGMKAARYDYVLHTCGNCRVASSIWMRLMMRHCIAGYEVVLGMSQPALMPDDEEIATAAPAPMRLSRMAMFDMQWDMLRTYGTALMGNPFMGDGCNLVYAKRLFFDKKGFCKTLNLKYGDDDLFVCDIANSRNCAVEISPDARVYNLATQPQYMYGVNKVRRLFTAELLPRRPYFFMSAMSWLSWLFLIALVAAIVLSVPSVIMVAAAVALIPAICLPLMLAWRKTGKALGMPRTAFLTQPFMMLAHPLQSWKYKRRLSATRAENYTWSQKL